jgi:HPt (histidine-containing phosphotransfer) domain-containing protein
MNRIIAMTAHASNGKGEHCPGAGPTATPSWNDVEPPSFDLVAALESFAGVEMIFREVSGVFLDDCPRLLHAVRRAAEAGSVEELKAAAHTLKGAVSHFAAADAYAAAMALEHMGRDGRLDGVATGVGTLEQAVGRLTAVLEAHLAGPSAAS